MTENTVPFPEDEMAADETSADANAASSDDAAGSIEEQLAQVTEERDQNFDQLMRTRAELDNVRRRTRTELDDQRKYQSLSLARDLLPGLDNLQRAITAGESSGNVTDLLQGLEMVLNQFENTFTQHGLKKIEAVGKPFDPNFHEAIQNMPSEDIPAMHVIAEAETGYVLNDRVVRPSKVLVSSGPASAE
ncbi:heat shock protein GrpE [Polystyrenella longa]|uniref:Protein GrpE n=1 Tax=Polystyrenella longa TaxID=2528007 RepID=A0A518CJ68_9PLAN|nr:nucleotide exchange factor GrpE [Polystyrenella longa]QDU79271.1 heat shock protein GrpE [Polystyrenella longa]